MNTQASQDIDEVQMVIVSDPLRFKAKLGVGEAAFKSLSVTNTVREVWDLVGAAGGGAAVASSSMVATTFFAPTGVLAALGLATAVTPVGWVIAAGAVSAGAWCGLNHALKKAKADRVVVIPKFLNTPVDALAMSLADLIVPLALKVAKADGHVSQAERAYVTSYLVEDWGYSPDYAREVVRRIEEQLDALDVIPVATCLAHFSKSNPDCVIDEVAQEVPRLLEGIIAVDGLSDRDAAGLIEQVTATLEKIRGKTAAEAVSETVAKSASTMMGGAGRMHMRARDATGRLIVRMRRNAGREESAVVAGVSA